LTKTTKKGELAQFELVAGILENYANKAVFRGFHPGPANKGRADFRMMWHHDKVFELVVDFNKHTLRFPALLPNIPADSEMYKEFKTYLASRQSAELVPHRRIDPAKAVVRASNRNGEVSVTLTIQDGDYDYGTRRIIHLIDETFKVFLRDGPYYEYLVEVFDLDPDKV
jgi:hypothetical protein